MAIDAVFMKVPDIEGTSTLVGSNPGDDGSHEKWIPVISCSFDFQRDEADVSDPKAGSDKKEMVPTTIVQPITVERVADVTSAPLLSWLAAKPEDPDRKKDEVLIDYCVRSGKYFLRYKLSGVELVSCALSYAEPHDAKETLTLTYDRIAIFQRSINSVGEVITTERNEAKYTVNEE